jgi:hypothetical protein
MLVRPSTPPGAAEILCGPFRPVVKAVLFYGYAAFMGVRRLIRR